MFVAILCTGRGIYVRSRLEDIALPEPIMLSINCCNYRYLGLRGTCSLTLAETRLSDTIMYFAYTSVLTAIEPIHEKTFFRFFFFFSDQVCLIQKLDRVLKVWI